MAKVISGHSIEPMGAQPLTTAGPERVRASSSLILAVEPSSRSLYRALTREVVCSSHSEVFSSVPPQEAQQLEAEPQEAFLAMSSRGPADGACVLSQLRLTQTRLCPPTGRPPAHRLSPTPLLSSNRRLPQKSRSGPRVRTRKHSQRMARGKDIQSQKVTDFYPIRRSSRRSKAELECEQKQQMDALITGGVEEGMEMRYVEGKGRAVITTRCFRKGEYVVEYHGDLLDLTDARKREAEYALDPDTGCYMYYFHYLSRTYCVDATRETGRMGRLINHSKSGNCHTKLHDIDGVPHLVLVASRDIRQGEELLYDYGDRSKASIAAHPWLKH
ncbi:N-lysine methyltransferase KMT5A-A [Neosynchiropus ocellatus]